MRKGNIFSYKITIFANNIQACFECTQLQITTDDFCNQNKNSTSPRVAVVFFVISMCFKLFLLNLTEFNKVMCSI